MDETIKTQILQVRDTGLTNLFDIQTVSTIAQHLQLDELTVYLALGNVGDYTRFILTGRI
ncbi:MAG: DUF5049 domain-containing protein [Eubacteriales bacterium]|jgi:hypothetical protein|nr:DUF5049 domain-containing protein [Eubacteriales bacterium]NCB67134.1 DUF5049 domain-containing protein [Bacilli bacterium]